MRVSKHASTWMVEWFP
jgi:hypothetical protein